MTGEWTPSDAAGLNEFLNTQLGRKWMGVMLAQKPKLDLSTTERAALSGAFVAGYEHLLFTVIGVHRNAGQLSKPTASKPGIDPEKD